MIAGILPPTTGRVEIYGQVSTLLALGLGVNKNLSGRENVLLGGMTAGLSPEMIEEQFDEIVAFADIGDFIDLPVRTYSSGMRGRLAFAVSVHMRPDILRSMKHSRLVARHSRKTARKIRELCDETGTIILVSHGTETIARSRRRYCCSTTGNSTCGEPGSGRLLNVSGLTGEMPLSVRICQVAQITTVHRAEDVPTWRIAATLAQAGFDSVVGHRAKRGPLMG